MEQKEIYIETERIIIRNFKQKDAEGFWSIFLILV